MQWILWILAVLLSAGAGFWVYRTDKKRALPFAWLSSLLRAVLVFMVFLLLIAPEITFNSTLTRKPIVLLLQDNSISIKKELGAATGNYLKQLDALKSRLSEHYQVVQWSFGETTETDRALHFDKGATNIARAISDAQAYFAVQNLGAIVLATDGRYNEGANPLYQQVSLPCALYTVAIGDSAATKDLKIGQVYYNKTVSLKNDFEIRADVLAKLCKGTEGNILLKEGNKVLGTVALHVGNDVFDRSVGFTVNAAEKGLHHYTLSVPVAFGEKNITNNTRDIFVEVAEEKKQVLILYAAPHPDVNAVKEALSGTGMYKVDIRAKDNMPDNLQEYSVVILHGLPSLGWDGAKRIEALHKPIWFMLGRTTDASLLLKMENIGGRLDANLMLNWSENARADLNKYFTVFTLPQKAVAVMDEMPPLVAPGGLMNIRPDVQVLFNYRGYAGTNDMPLWVMERSNTPKALLLGEGIWRWRLYEYKNFNNHEVIDECIKQTVAYLAANNNDKPFRVSMPKNVWSDQERVNMEATLMNANNELVNDAAAKISITDSAGHEQNYMFERSGKGYRLNIGILSAGSYTYSAVAKLNEKAYTAHGSFAVANVPLELMETGADYELLNALSKKYQGCLFPAAAMQYVSDSIAHNTSIKPILETVSESVSVIDKKWVFFLILLFAVSEWLLRKYWMAQ